MSGRLDRLPMVLRLSSATAAAYSSLTPTSALPPRQAALRCYWELGCRLQQCSVAYESKLRLVRQNRIQTFSSSYNTTISISPLRSSGCAPKTQAE